MKRLTTCFLATLLTCHGVALADEIPYPKVPEELRFVYQDSTYTDSESERILVETPGITDGLYDLLWQFVEVKDETQIRLTLNALGRRRDMNKVQLKGITDHIRSLSIGSLAKLPEDEWSFFRDGIHLLKSFPSPEHEDLALMLLEKDNDGVKVVALGVLSEIGTRKSVEPVRRFMDTRWQQIDPSLIPATLGPGVKEYLQGSEARLLARIGAAEPKTARENTSDPDQPLDAKKSMAAKKVVQVTAKDKSGWQVWTAILIVVIGMAVWFLRSRLVK